MIKQHNSISWLKLNGLLRMLLARGMLRGVFNNYIINEFPKSGGSWLGQMISEATELPFPRNRLPVLNNSILHGHYVNPWNIKNVVLLWRDGRDVIISLYFQSLFNNEKGNSQLVKLTRENFHANDYSDIKANLPNFIRYLNESKIWPNYTWSDFVNNWGDKNVVHVKYEDLRIDATNELIRITEELCGLIIDKETSEKIVFKYSFENQTGRRSGIEKRTSFMRKGLVGDWKNHFSVDAKKVFNKYAGKELIKLGYELNEDWIYE